jgi:hypothetical protein
VDFLAHKIFIVLEILHYIAHSVTAAAATTWGKGNQTGEKTKLPELNWIAMVYSMK